MKDDVGQASRNLSLFEKLVAFQRTLWKIKCVSYSYLELETRQGTH